MKIALKTHRIVSILVIGRQLCPTQSEIESIVDGDVAGRAAQGGHGHRGPRQAGQQPVDLVGQGPQRPQLGVEPVQLLGGGQVAVFDPKSNVPPQQFPLKRTPLNLILARNVDFTKSNMVVGHRDDGTATVVKVQDPEHPEYGNIELKFTGNPVELRQWVITNDAGQQTTVILGDLAKGVQIGARPFNIVQEIQARGLN